MIRFGVIKRDNAAAIRLELVSMTKEDSGAKWLAYADCYLATTLIRGKHVSGAQDYDLKVVDSGLDVTFGTEGGIPFRLDTDPGRLTPSEIAFLKMVAAAPEPRPRVRQYRSVQIRSTELISKS